MRHILLDANILADLCFDRKQKSDPGLEILRRCQQGIFVGYTTPWCLLTVMYLMGKAKDPAGTRIWTDQDITKEAGELLSFLTLVEAGNGHFASGFAYGWPDWEDAIIHAVAVAHPKIEVVVTNDQDYMKRAKKLGGLLVASPSMVIRDLSK